MKYNVTCTRRTAEMIEATINAEIADNYIGDTIEADTAEEAIEIAMDYIAEQINAVSEHRAEVEGSSVIVYGEDDEVIEEYTNFEAK